jgi:hypothetical protein
MSIINNNHISLSNVDIDNFIDVFQYNDNIECIQIVDSHILTIDTLPYYIKKLIVVSSNLKKIDKCIPISLELINITNNLIDCLDFMCGNIKYLFANSNFIENLCFDGTNLIRLFLDDNKFETIDDFCYMENLKILSLKNNNISNIDILEERTPNLLKLDISECNIKTINKLPPKLKVLLAASSGIEYIKCEFPQNLNILVLNNNKIDEYPIIPYSVKHINLSSNKITKYDNFHSNMEIIDITNNNQLKLTENQIKLIQHIKQCGCNVKYDNVKPGIVIDYELNYDRIIRS